MKNRFLTSIFSGNTVTENGAISNSTTRSLTLDYFSKAGTYRNRSLDEVFADISAIYAEEPLSALKVIFYNRMISRKLEGFMETETLQVGQGNKDEFRKAVKWFARYQPEILNKNLWMIPLLGCWKDLWHIELVEELDQSYVFRLIERGLNCDYNRELLAKYLPRIRSKSNVHNDRHRKLNAFAFDLIKFLDWSPIQYRRFKSNGIAHEFQQKMSKQLFHEINFNKVPGKALHQLVNKRGKDQMTTFERHGLNDVYIEWIRKQPIAKFTGYVYELLKVVNSQMGIAQRLTVDKQFEGLLQKAKASGSISENVWCALDTSGSMEARVADTTAFDICLSLGIYFSSLNEGAFKDHVIMFDNKSKVKKLSGSFSDKALQLKSAETAWGSTNFQSVIDEVIRIRIENPKIPIEDYPSTLLVVSDMQFNPAGLNRQSNYKRAMRKLAKVGLSDIRIIWWWVTGRGTDFPSTIDDKGVIMLGGFDGSILSLLLGEEPVQKEVGTKFKRELGPMGAMNKALDQELLAMIQV